MRTFEEDRPKAEEMLRSQPFAVLATHGVYPHTSLVSFWVSEDLQRLAFLTSRDTRKYQNIIADDKVALMADDRTNNPSADVSQASSVIVKGRAKEATGEQDVALRRLFLQRHPYMESFASSSGTALMVIEVETLDLISRFQS